MTEPDYVTVNRAVTPGNPSRFCVLLMKYHQQNDEYLAVKCSEALPEAAARALAQSWAAALQLDVR